MSGIDERSLAPGCVAQCRGCAHRHLSASQSAAQKQAWLQRQLAPWAEALVPLHLPARRWAYRDRVCLGTEWDGQWRMGLIANRRLLPIPQCPVHSERIRAAVALLGRVLPEGARFPMVYFVQSGAQLTLVLKTAARPPVDWLDATVAAELSGLGLEGLWLHLHPAAGKKIFAKNSWELLWGEPRSLDRQGLWYGPASFQQLIPALYGAALEEAEGYLRPGPQSAIVDLYAGSGGTLRRWHGCGAQAIGVELGGEAVACGRLNVPGVELLRGTCRDRLPQLRAWAGRLAPDRSRLAYVNPPRTGLEPEVLQWLAGEYRPARLAYLSCSAGTLRRDLEQFTDAGYVVDRISPYDFFPQTYHVETLVLLRRGDS